MQNIKFDFDDILITPKTHTSIESRFNQINPYVLNDKLFLNKYPLFTAPMSSVVDENNYLEYNEMSIPVVLPRTVKNKTPDSVIPKFHSFSLSEFKDMYFHDNETVPLFALIDIANGHMEKIIELSKIAKKNYPSLKIMAGNIANPETYRWYVESNVIDYARIGIGNGNGCLTTQQTGVGYPSASLIRECYEIKKECEKTIDESWDDYNNPKLRYVNFQKPTKVKENVTKIIADGGMKDYSDIIKALALGADYVMVGSIFNKALESSGDNYLYKYKISPKLAKDLYDFGFTIRKQYYGMSTKLAQKKMGNSNLKTSEGVIRYRKVEYTLFNWINNFDHYLRTAMSYSDALTLDDFIGKADYNFITQNGLNRFKK